MPRSFSTSHGRRSDPKLFNVPNDLQPNTFSGEGDERAHLDVDLSMSIHTWSSIPGRPAVNVKQERTIEATWTTPSDLEAAHAWMRQDKANRMVEGEQRFPWGHNQILWERVDKSKPIGFTCVGGQRWLSFYPEAEQPGGCLHNYTGDEFKRHYSPEFPFFEGCGRGR